MIWWLIPCAYLAMAWLLFPGIARRRKIQLQNNYPALAKSDRVMDSWALMDSVFMSLGWPITLLIQRIASVLKARAFDDRCP